MFNLLGTTLNCLIFLKCFWLLCLLNMYLKSENTQQLCINRVSKSEKKSIISKNWSYMLLVKESCCLLRRGAAY